jgi:hypothetical protein
MSTMEELFRKAIENKWRFPAAGRNVLSLEELYDLPLAGNNGTNLDTVANLINNELQVKRGKVSFVTTNTRNDREVAELEDKLELVKDVIQVKLERNAARQEQVAKASEKAMLEALLVQKQTEALKNLSEEEIRKRLAEL